MNKRSLTTTLCACLTLALATAFFLTGCGNDTRAMQDFVDGYLEVMEELESKPEVAQAGREASTAYMNSGFTDLESAEKARLSYVESSKNDRAGLEDLGKVQAPDQTSQNIKVLLASGISDVDKGNEMFADSLAAAPGQTVEQRATQAQDIAGPMGMYVSGMTDIVSSLADLQAYVKDNGLKGGAEVQKWYDKIKGELESVKQYAPE